MRAYMPKSSHDHAGGALLAAYGICVICISLGNWQRAFWTGGLFLTVAGVLWLAAITALERLAHRDGIEDVLAQGNVRSTLPEKKSTQQLVLTLAPVCLAACIHGLLKDGIMTWVPSFLQEKFSLLTAFSVSLTMLLPLVNLSGVYIGNAVNVRRFRNEASTACLFFGVCGAGLLLWLFWGKESLGITFAVLLFSTTCLTSVSTMLLSLLPLRFRRQGQTATVTGPSSMRSHMWAALCQASASVPSAPGGGGMLCFWLRVQLRRWAQWRAFSAGAADINQARRKASPHVQAEVRRMCPKKMVKDLLIKVK